MIVYISTKFYLVNIMNYIVTSFHLDCQDSVIKLPPLLDDITCYQDDTCMGIQCCLDVDFISRSFHSFLTVDPCNYVIRFGVEKLKFDVTMDTFDWGEWKQFDLYGVVTLR